MSRGNRKSSIFEDDYDRDRFLDIVRDACESYAVLCLAYCLMGNHYHLVLEPPRSNLSWMMRDVNGEYAQYSNRRHGRTGHVFEGPFTSIPVENDHYLRTVVKYVVTNPIAAGLVQDASGWDWSSYRATAGLSEPPVFLNLDWMEVIFGSHAGPECQARYRTFIDEPFNINDEKQLELLMGSPAFEISVRSYVGASMYRMALPKAYRALARPTLANLFSTVGWTRPERDQMIRRAHVLHGYQLSEIATYLGMHPNSMSKVLRRLKDIRSGTARAKSNGTCP
ncbi:MAG: transposase [Acidobacteriota bacterium]|nr:transposase [Acidobacteriota bacterium]